MLLDTHMKKIMNTVKDSNDRNKFFVTIVFLLSLIEKMLFKKTL